MHCHILNIGPDSEVQRSLKEFMETEGLGTPRHIETAGIAIDVLSQLPECELPHIIVIPFRLPILSSVDFIVRMRLHERLQSIPIFVWGPHIPAHEIHQMYTAGAACVLPGQFSSVHLVALRQFLRNCICIETGATGNKPLSEITSVLRHTAEKAFGNAQLGAVFAWTGCISTVFWTRHIQC
jgi:hypothetical protein